jgi:hypothetical protein
LRDQNRFLALASPFVFPVLIKLWYDCQSWEEAMAMRQYTTFNPAAGYFHHFVPTPYVVPTGPISDILFLVLLTSLVFFE